jgi:hypothetical protein
MTEHKIKWSHSSLKDTRVVPVDTMKLGVEQLPFSRD